MTAAMLGDYEMDEKHYAQSIFSRTQLDLRKLVLIDCTLPVEYR
jgi:hypothetical protein